MRSALGLVVALMIAGFGAASPSIAASSKVSRDKSELITIMTDSFDAAGMRYAADIAAVLDGEQNLRVVPMAGRGPVETINDILYLRGVDTGIVPADVIAFMKDQDIAGDADGKLLALAKLGSAQVHVVTRREITSLAGLAGKRVDIGSATQPRFLTGTLLFKKLEIPIIPVNSPRTEAIRQLIAGMSDAAVIVEPQPSPVIEELAQQSQLHLLPVPMADGMADLYSPALINAKSYGTLLDGGNVESIAVSSLIAVFDWPKNTERYYAMKKFSSALFASGGVLLTGSRNGAWRDINLAGDIPGWERYVTSEEWLAKHKADTTLPAEDAKALREQLQSVKKFTERRSSAGTQED